jgi:orotate phosphoribosyltransferase
MTREELGQRIYDLSYLTGNFTLRSGVYSNEYFDKYRFESQPDVLQAVAKKFAQLLPDNIDALAGLELGGIPLVTALSIETGLPCVFVRKEAKNHGTKNWVEGMQIEGQRLCVIEDVITTGGQVISSIENLRQEGATVEHALCVILRSGKAVANLENYQIQLQTLFTMSDLKVIGQAS